ncbi:MAG: right-handed parallel beta-helix repeat-containing protein [Bacilli bacterium]|nr:right-handed parallel beta-helix repeat-containing protein [Bacilli bacterium]
MKKYYLLIFLLLLFPLNVCAKAKVITLDVEDGADISLAWNNATSLVKNDESGFDYKIVIPDGNYTSSSQLYIWSNTHIFMEGVKITHKDDSSSMIRFATLDEVNEANDNKGYSKYSGFDNITIEGGILDGGNLKQEILKVGHASNITLKNVTFTNVKENHHVEFGAVDNLLVTGCTFSNYQGNYSLTTNNEALQIDALVDDHFSTYNPNDDETPSKNVTIDNCTFKNLQRGVGTHTGIINSYFDNIKITNNTFTNITGYAIIATNYKNSIIENNNIYNAGAGILFRTMEQAHENFYSSKVNNNIHNTYEDMNSIIRNNKIMINKGYKVKYKNVGYAIELYGEELTSDIGTTSKGDFRVSGVTIKDNDITLKNVSYGIWLQGAIKNTIDNNNIVLKFTSATTTSTGDGIKLINSTNNNILNNNIENNTISSNYYLAKDMNGIALNQSSSNNTVNKNRVTYAIKDGIHIDESNSNNIKKNTIISAQRHGINIESSLSNTVNNGNLVFNSVEFGLRLGKSNNNKINNNVFQATTNDGIHIEYSNKNTINNNIVSSNKRDGINIQISNSNTIKSNTITSAKRNGINLEKSNSNNVSSNKIYSSSQHGIRLYNAKKNKIKKNQIINVKKDGIHLEKSNNNVIDNKNNISAIKNGIYLYKSNSNTIYNNIISDTKGNGINIISSKLNVVLYNKITKALNGIYIEKSNSITLTGNKINKSKENGIYLVKCKKISIFSNIIKKSKLYGIKASKKQLLYDLNNSFSSNKIKKRNY